MNPTGKKIEMNKPREIKFRAWNVRNQVMVDDFVISPTGEKLTHSGNLLYEGVYETKLELMQCTGLKDKNGTEIYEGDIVGDFSEKRLPKHLVVVWGTDGFELSDEVKGGSWYVKPEFVDDDWGSHCEVIGNIYENKELIK